MKHNSAHKARGTVVPIKKHTLQELNEDKDLELDRPFTDEEIRYCEDAEKRLPELNEKLSKLLRRLSRPHRSLGGQEARDLEDLLCEAMEPVLSLALGTGSQCLYLEYHRSIRRFVISAWTSRYDISINDGQPAQAVEAQAAEGGAN